MSGFSSENGLYGKVILDSTYILATGGSIDLTHEPLVSSGIWGAGYKDAATVVAFASNVVTIEGSIDFELTTNFWAKLKAFGWDDRGASAGKNLKVLPQGTAGFDGKAWCTGMSFSGSENSLVTGSFNWASYETDKVTSAAATDRSTHVDMGNVGKIVFPYWATKVSTVTDGVIDWSANYTAAINFVTLCNHLGTTPPTQPDWMVIGTMDADGSFTMFGMANDLFIASKLQTIPSGGIDIEMKDFSAGTSYKIQFPQVIYNSSSPPVVTGGDYVSISVSFTGVGDGTNAPMYLT